jgi:hypothetical protein
MISLWNNGVAVRIILVVAGVLFGPASNIGWAGPQEPVRRAITIPDGTPVHLYLMDDLTSKKAKKGDAVSFKVREGIRVGGAEIIPAGSPVIGRIVGVGHSSFAGHSGKLGLAIEYVVAANGTKIPLRGEATLKGGSNGAVTAAATVYWGPPALLMRGWDAEIHQGTLLNAYVNGDQFVTLENAAGNIAMRAEGSIGAWSDQNPTVRHDGVVLSRVDSGGPADQVGIKLGDVILAVNGHYLYTAAELRREISGIAPGTRTAIRYQRRSTIYDTYLVVSEAEQGQDMDLGQK